jgi:hypothetical protein
MKLIRRKPKPTPAQQALGVVSKVVRGLAAVRVARSAYGTYRFARRLPLVLGGLGVVAGGVVLARKLKGGSGEPQTETWAPPAAATTSAAPVPSAPAAEPPTDSHDASVVPELEPNPAETAGTGSPEPELVEEDPATPPTVSAIADEEIVAETPEDDVVAATGSSSDSDTEDERPGS